MSDGALSRHPWVTLDGPTLVSSAAALQLVPENIGRLIRLQRLAAIGVSLPSRTNAPSLSPSKLCDLLKHPLVSGPEIRREEDPYDDIYAVEIPYIGGPHLVLQGLSERSGYVANLLTKAVFGPAGQGLGDEFRTTAKRLTVVLLRLSNEMCRRAGIKRGLAPLREQIREVRVPGQDQMATLRAAVTFSNADLAELLPSSAASIIQNLSIPAGQHQVNLKSMTDDQLVLTPLLLTNDGLIVSSPSDLAAALRHHLILASQELGCTKILARAFREQAMAEASHLLEILGCANVCDIEDSEPMLSLKRRFHLSGEKFIELTVVADDFSNYVADDPFGREDFKRFAFQKRLEREPSGGVQPEDVNTLQLVVLQGAGRAAAIIVRAKDHEGPTLLLQLDELQVMVELACVDALFVWRFACANTKFRSEVNLLSWSTLDNLWFYIKRDHSYYLSDQKMPNLVSFEVASGLPLRVEAQRRFDHHVVLSPHVPIYIPVYAVYGINTAPIYRTHPGASATDDVEYVVEVHDLQIWIGSARIRDPALLPLRDAIVETLAYWMWQLGGSAPELVRNGSNDAGQIYIQMSLDSERAWITALASSVEEEASGVFISSGKRDRGRIELRFLANGSHLLLAENNEADRAIVHSLLFALSKLWKDSNLDISVLLEDLIPLGDKRMLHSISSGEVLLRPGQLPQPRFLQPAVTGIVLDELGEWLRSQGHQAGPIPPDRRTYILNNCVEHHFSTLAGLIVDLSPIDLIQQLIKRDEAILHRHASESSKLGSRIACFGEASSLTEDLVRDQKNHLEVAVASRFLIEYVSAMPPRGVKILTLDTYDYLLSLSAEIISRGTLSDAFRYGFSESELAILNSGRLGVSRGDRFQSGIEALVLAQTSVLRQILANPVEVDTFSKPAETPSVDTDTAMLAEFGFTFKDLAEALGELVALGDERCETEPYELTATEVETHLCTELGWQMEKVHGLLDRLSLRQRDEFLSVGSDANPWRYNREWSYVRRPLVRLEDDAGEVRFVWGARRLWTAGAYWLDLVFSARLRAQSAEMKSLLGKIRQRQNSNFELNVEAVFKSAGLAPTATRVSKILGHKLLSAEGQDLGDIDVIGIDLDRRIVLIAEAKDFEIARTPAELANEAHDLIQSEKSANFRLSRRALWVKTHLRIVLTHFGIAETYGDWRVKPVIVTSSDLVSPRVLASKIPIVPIDGLSVWISKDLNGSAPRRDQRHTSGKGSNKSKRGIVKRRR